MNYLKQSAAVTIRLGPYVDKADGVTEKTAITPVCEVSKNHGAFAARSSGGSITHDANGWYAVPLDTTDTGTAGPLLVKSDDAATYLPVWREFIVLTANAYDALVAGSGNGLRGDVQAFGGTAGSFAAGVPAASLTSAERTAVATEMFGTVTENNGSITFKGFCRLVLSALAGRTVVSGASADFKTPNNAKTRISATTDATNSRTAITLDVTD